MNSARNARNAIPCAQEGINCNYSANTIYGDDYYDDITLYDDIILYDDMLYYDDVYFYGNEAMVRFV